jgi:hypothetical protein
LETPHVRDFGPLGDNQSIDRERVIHIRRGEDDVVSGAEEVDALGMKLV